MSSSISNLKINNISSAATVRVTDGRPTLTWTFIGEKIATPSSPTGDIASVRAATQKSCEVRIGTSSVNLGFSSYIGTLASGEFASDAQFWRYNGFDIVRAGGTYYGQVRVKDEFDNYSNWVTFSLSFPPLPTVTGVAITPASPSFADTLSVTFTSSSNAGPAQIRWFRNGIHERWLDGHTEVSSDYVKTGDQWVVQVRPNDGAEYGNTSTSMAVTIHGSMTLSLPITNAAILPSDPTPNDPLYAFYAYLGDEKVSIRWYVNGELRTEANDSRYWRFDLNVGDVVYFDAFTESAGSDAVAVSAEVDVVAGFHKVTNLRVNDRAVHLSVPNQTPYIYWDTVSPSGSQRPSFAHIAIGYGPGTSEVLDEVVTIPDNRFIVPPGLLRFGADYWIAVSVGDSADTLGEPATTHFRLSGSLWETYADNGNGWTVEAVLHVGQGYQTIRLADGSKFAEIRLSPDQVQVFTKTVSSGSASLGEVSLHAVTITGQNDEINVYVDGELVVNATLDQTTNEKYLEFGSSGSGSGWWRSFNYSVDGPVVPNTPAYESIVYEEMLSLPQRQVTGLNRSDTYFANTLSFREKFLLTAQTTDQTAEFIAYNPLTPPVLRPTVSRTYTPINRIVSSPSGRYVCFAHANGATWIKSRPVVRYDQLLNLTRRNPEDYAWTMFASSDWVTDLNQTDGLKIDTTQDGGKWYYSQDRHGTPWFDGADNSTGWTLDFTLRVDAVSDDGTPVIQGQPEGVGVYVNDGSYSETINFFATEIIFGSSGAIAPFDTTIATDYRLLGKGDSIELWAKPDDDASFTLIAKGVLTRRGTPEGNGGRPHVCVDADGVQHAVWHDDGRKVGRQIMYSRLIGGEWSLPQVVVPPEFNASNPRITAAGEKLMLVFEQRNAERCVVGYAVRNIWGWGEPTVLLDGGHDCKNPQIAANTDGTVYVAWEDYRDMTPSVWVMSRSPDTAAWTDLGKANTTATKCCRPALDASGGRVAVTWTQQATDDRSSIYARVYDALSESWTVAKEISENDSFDADFSDVVIQDEFVQIVWHDNRGGGEYNIYTQRLTESLTVVQSTSALTNSLENGSVSSRFPRIGHNTSGSESLIVVFQRSNEIDKNAGVSGTPTLTSTMCVSVFDVSSGSWTTSPTTFETSPRYSRRPCVSRRFAGNARVVYEAELVTDISESQPTTDTFAIVRDAEFTFATGLTYTVSASLDHCVSGQLPRREARFGDFSDAYKAKYAFSRIGMYLADAVEPYEIGLVSASTSKITDERAYDALVNDNGDAWIGTQAGLSLYLRSQNRLVNFDDSPFKGQPVTAIAIDANGVLFVASGANVYSSSDHVTFGLAATIGGTVRDMAFAADGSLWLATDAGVFSHPSTSDYANGAATITLGNATVALQDNNPQANDVRCVAVDLSGRVWYGTQMGLYSYLDGNRKSYFEENGLPSNIVNDISLRSEYVRYVSTMSGVVQMVEDRIESLSSDKTPWVNNARAVLFQYPNTLWVTAMSDISQVQLDDVSGNNSTLVYNISNYAPDATAYNNLRTFYVQSPPDAVTPATPAEVFVNGRRCDFGYILSSDRKTVQFDTALRATDKVEVKYRLDLQTIASMQQNKAEVLVEGKTNTRATGTVVTHFDVKDSDTGLTLVHTLMDVDGNSYLYRFDGSSTALSDSSPAAEEALPFDEIVLDTTPPTGELRILKQIDRYTIKLAIEYADDNLSGVSKMIVSNYPNFTTDGKTPQTPIDYAPEIIHTVNDALDYIVTLHEFATDGPKGSRVLRYARSSDVNEIYVGTQYGATILKYDPENGVFNTVTTLDTSPAASIDFMIQFKNWLIVGVGKVGGSTRVMYSSDGQNYTLVGSIAAQHAYAACVAFDKLWVGAADGKLYSWGGGSPSFDPLKFVCDSGQQTIWAVQSGRGKIFMATGDQGNLIAYDPFADAQQVFYTDPDPNLTAMDMLVRNSVYSVYVGTGNTGRILNKKAASSSPMGVSYQYTPSRVTAIKIDDAGMRFAIENKMWKGTANPGFSGWTPFASFDENVVDFEPAASSGDINNIEVWVVTQNKVLNVRPPDAEKRFYLQLIDNAGNKSPVGQIFDGISVTDLLGYVNENRILTLDPSGRMVDYIDGVSPYYSVRKVEQETGEYYSEVFFGTNNLLAWDNLSFDCDTPSGTEVTIFLRTGNTRDDCLSSDWIAEYGSNYKGGISISYLQGRYIQFKAVLSTTTSDSTPLLRRVTVQSKTSEATHFYTTNFILGSKIKKGLLTTQKFVPVAADVIFGIDTRNSREFADYQIIEPDKIFTVDDTQIGTGLRIGIKLITPTPSLFITDTFGEYGPGDTPLYVNTIEFEHGNVSSTFHYRISFFKDAPMADEVYVAFSQNDTSGWTANGAAIEFEGVDQVVGEMKRIAYGPTGETPLLCNEYYYVKVEAYDLVEESFSTISTGHTFVSACNTTFVDTIAFDHKATANATYQFRVRMYNDIERTDLAKVYYTGTKASYWMADTGAFPSTGLAMTTGQTSTITLTPPPSEMVPDKVYHLSIDAFDGTSFGDSENSLTFRVSEPSADTYCGEYTNVPVVKNFAMVLTLEDGRTIQFNSDIS